jgi:hypothetical protein
MTFAFLRPNRWVISTVGWGFDGIIGRDVDCASDVGVYGFSTCIGRVRRQPNPNKCAAGFNWRL